MTATAEITNPIELRRAGVKALAAALGGVNAINFLEQWRGGDNGDDCTVWLRENEATIDEYEARIMRMQEEDRAAGWTPWANGASNSPNT
jgi:hypothetical protein